MKTKFSDRRPRNLKFTGVLAMPRHKERSDSTPASSASSSRNSSSNDASTSRELAIAATVSTASLEAASSSLAPLIAEQCVLRHLRKRDTAAIAAWIDSGGNVNALDEQGRTLLMLAVSRVDVPTIQLLLRHLPPGGQWEGRRELVMHAQEHTTYQLPSQPPSVEELLRE